METFRYRQFDWRPGAVLQEPLSRSRIAMVTTAAFYRPDQAPFDESVRGGDYSFREIPLETDLDTLQIAHKSDAFDHAGIESDKNLALRLARARYDARLGSYLELLVATAEAEKARADHAQSLYAYEIAKARLRTSLGVLP